MKKCSTQKQIFVRGKNTLGHKQGRPRWSERIPEAAPPHTPKGRPTPGSPATPGHPSPARAVLGVPS